jgi:L-ribulose-5-phosphate 3-epimerase
MMNASIDRRRFLQSSTALLGATMIPGITHKALARNTPGDTARFRISLAQWSLHRALGAGTLDNLDFPRIAREDFGIDAVEWSNHFLYVRNDTYGYQPKPRAYLSEMKRRTREHGVRNLLIMCDEVGLLGDPDTDRRRRAVEGHYAWVEAARYLDCHSIRVNSASDPSLGAQEQKRLCADGLSRLCAFARDHDINVIIENHGGLSSNGAWLASVIREVASSNCGTLPDFGNFYVTKQRGDAEQYARAKAPYKDDPVYTENDGGLEYDRYRGMRDLMPFAKGVSAKSHDFNAQGEEIHSDYGRMLQIIAEAGYKGYIGIEYEGSKTPEMKGIALTQALLEKTIAAMETSDGAADGPDPRP